MTRQPTCITPMLATLYKEKPFNDSKWLFEKKLDGVRCLAFYDGKKVRLMTRNKRLVNKEYPEIVEEVKQLSENPFILDGEIVVKKGKIGSFNQMQTRIGVKKPSKKLQKQSPVSYYAFDLLFLDDNDLREKPLLNEKNYSKNSILQIKSALLRTKMKQGRHL